MPRRVTIWLATCLLVAGCGGGPRPAPRADTPSPSPASSSPASSSPASATPASPVGSPTALPSVEPRRGQGGRRADDVDGDGRADLAVEVRTRDGQLARTVFLGSPGGLGQGKRLSVTSSASCDTRLLHDNWVADFDGDGHGDILGSSGGPGGRPCVFWGPRPLTARQAPVRVAVPEGKDINAYSVVAGDFDGDGAADLAMPSSTPGEFLETDLVVLYGPFSRDGKPARRTVRPAPSRGEFRRLGVDLIDGRRATGLVVYEPDDGEQTAVWLFRGGPGGLEKSGHKLNDGGSVAFGDFDGDGTRDVAVGDSGSRNNEPGYETEPPSVHRVLTVYYGDGRTATFTGTAGPIAAGDFDGDGRDDLAFGGGHEYEEAQPVLVFRGGPDGLGQGVPLDGVSPARPWAAGDFDGDGDDELVLAEARAEISAIVVTDGAKVLTRFDVPAG
ncbi:FG-GAP and VCBS repeat-containing protein [Nonomuraea sp. NPDC048826]|uniref:FG-GAP and VCBS repeat-containing protein n=1 Tax=Nonomuraea sp. NPDC048826 TaxID=3364347 RepID=UPI0037114AD2